MNKRGWNTPVGLILIIILVLSLFSAISYLNPAISGNIVRIQGSDQVTIHHKESISVNGVILQLMKIDNNNAILLEVDNKPYTIQLGEIINKEGLQLKVTEINNEMGDVLDYAVILVSDLGIEKVDSPTTTGRFEVAYGQRLSVGGNIIKIMPTDHDSIRVFFNDKNKEASKGETIKIEDHLVKYEDVKDFPDYDFDRIIISVKRPSKELWSIEGKTFDLAVNDPVEVDGKTVMLLRTDSMKDGRATIAVDGVVDTIENYETKMINDIEIKVTVVDDNLKEEFDRATIIVKENA